MKNFELQVGDFVRVLVLSSGKAWTGKISSLNAASVRLSDVTFYPVDDDPPIHFQQEIELSIINVYITPENITPTC